MADKITNVNSPPQQPKEGGGAGWAVAVIIIVAIILFFVFGLPRIRGENEGAGFTKNTHFSVRNL